MRNLSKKAKTIIAGAAIAGLASSGVAYAYWTQTGSGSGTASTGTTTSITVNQSGAPSAMYPGSALQALSGNFDNPNSGSVQIASVTAVVTSLSGQGTDTSKPACTTSDYQITSTAPNGSLVPSGNGVGGWAGLSIQLVNGLGNQDNCKGAVAHITYTANAV